ncbi:hypothetical protein [Actinomyces trachealis]|uniref:hypothetical protein n=1 Tax=Actinomyces trachealis TaxID=2763540 RepID=UPI0018929D71|nr:hypothetical protein [Actinomyces trachealis]
MDGDLTAVRAVTSDSALSFFEGRYNEAKQNGQRMSGSYTVHVKGVSTFPPGDQATVDVCFDQTSVVVLDSSGADVTGDRVQVQALTTYMVVYQDDGWKVSQWFNQRIGQC